MSTAENPIDKMNAIFGYEEVFLTKHWVQSIMKKENTGSYYSLEFASYSKKGYRYLVQYNIHVYIGETSHKVRIMRLEDVIINQKSGPRKKEVTDKIRDELLYLVKHQCCKLAEKYNAGKLTDIVFEDIKVF